MYCVIQIFFLSLYQQNETRNPSSSNPKRGSRKMMTYEQFCKPFIYTNEKKGICRLNSDFRNRFPGMTLKQAYESEIARWSSIVELYNKVKKFEQFLQSQHCQLVESKVSESRYYFYNGVKYRFSSHVYPTGSMTKRWEDGSFAIVDFAADPELINEINA